MVLKTSIEVTQTHGQLPPPLIKIAPPLLALPHVMTLKPPLLSHIFAPPSPMNITIMIRHHNT